jgi:hypothetical protein
MAVLITTLTCPACRHQAVETMPTDRCVFFYECGGCKALLRPKPGDCCVFCSYADQQCPSKQDERPCHE